MYEGKAQKPHPDEKENSFVSCTHSSKDAGKEVITDEPDCKRKENSFFERFEKFLFKHCYKIELIALTAVTFLVILLSVKIHASLRQIVHLMEICYGFYAMLYGWITRFEFIAFIGSLSFLGGIALLLISRST